MYPSELNTKVENKIKKAYKATFNKFTVTFYLTLNSAMFNGQMLFDRQMHVKMVCYLKLLSNFSCTEDGKSIFYIYHVVWFYRMRSLFPLMISVK